MPTYIIQHDDGTYFRHRVTHGETKHVPKPKHVLREKATVYESREFAEFVASRFGGRIFDTDDSGIVLSDYSVRPAECYPRRGPTQRHTMAVLYTGRNCD